MIRKLVFKNYRCFENSELDFKSLSVIVGNNNAGKSTLIEALRIVGFVAQKFKHTNYIPAPKEFGLPAIIKGIKINIELLKLDLRTIVYQYKEDVNAQVIAYFDNDVVIKVVLSRESAFAYIEKQGRVITKKTEAEKLDDLKLHIMPQIGLIREDEPKLTEETVQRDMATRLSSRHFRNELLLYKSEFFDIFTSIAQATWPGLRITDLVYDIEDSTIKLMVYDADYAAEIGLMGSGLQMWLQIIWFISRCAPDASIVLDEPDVYMHPDLQRKILKLVKNRFKQVIIATHSVEIISEVTPQQILTVDKKTRKMRYAGNYRAVQDVISNLGSEHNLSLVRLGNVKKCVFVEGKDIKILSKIQNVLFPDSLYSLEQLPTVSLGGWSRFDEALGAARLFYEETKGEIETYCILDRDYHTDEEITSLYAKAEESHLNLHVWSKKELENYILTPKTIYRALDIPGLTFEEFAKELSLELEPLREKTSDAILDYLAMRDRSKMPSYFRGMADKMLSEKWNSLEGRLSIANGKDIISIVNAWAQTKYKKSCSRNRLMEALTSEDVSEEMAEVICRLINSR